MLFWDRAENLGKTTKDFAPEQKTLTYGKKLEIATKVNHLLLISM